MKVFKSKIGLELFIPLILIFGFLLFQAILSNNMVAIVISIVVIGLVLHLFLTTTYTIIGNVLNIKSSFLINKNIAISSITKISKSNNLLSSPAMSIDRLEIIYNKIDTILVSPNSKKYFVEALLAINPNIEVKP